MNPRSAKQVFICAVALSFATGRLVLGNIDITLDNAFIDKVKDAVTIDASFIVDKAHKQPNPAIKDGDLHVAGRAKEVKLPMVAEVMNARSQPATAAVEAIHQAEGSNHSLPITGVWRLWCEHGGETEQIQGDPLTAFKTTNPPHVFQIHPITSVAGSSIIESVHQVEGYDAKDAESAFEKYEALRCHVEIVSTKKTSVTTTMAGYNYVKFVCRPSAPKRQLQDGTAVYAEIANLEGALLVHRRRMLFPKGSAAEQALNNLQENQEMVVLGIPRISLRLIAWRRDHAKTNKKALDWGLPYEIVVVGCYETRPKSDED